MYAKKKFNFNVKTFRLKLKFNKNYIKVTRDLNEYMVPSQTTKQLLPRLNLNS